MSNRKSEAGSPRGPRRELDEIDLRLLKLLVADPRRSQRALAKEVGLSPPAVADRIAALETAEVITGYTTSVDLAKLGRPLTVYMGVSCELGRDHLEQSKALSEIDEVERVVLTTGRQDLMLKINVRDREHLNEVLFRKLIEGSAKITHTDTLMSLGEFARSDYRLRVLDQLLEGDPAE